MKKVQGFTLVEMLVVMGIIVLLMAMGIGGGRIALQNASSTAFKAGVKQINEALLTHYAAKGAYPTGAAQDTPIEILNATTGALKDYIESFDGGNDTTYYYIVDDNGQVSLVCVELAPNLSAVRDIYCEGNGFGTAYTAANSNVTNSITITNKTSTATTTPNATTVRTAIAATGSAWTNKHF